MLIEACSARVGRVDLYRKEELITEREEHAGRAREMRGAKRIILGTTDIVRSCAVQAGW